MRARGLQRGKEEGYKNERLKTLNAVRAGMKKGVRQGRPSVPSSDAANLHYNSRGGEQGVLTPVTEIRTKELRGGSNNIVERARSGKVEEGDPS